MIARLLLSSSILALLAACGGTDGSSAVPPEPQAPPEDTHGGDAGTAADAGPSTAAVTPPHIEAGTIQMNDVSILLPFPVNADAHLAASAPGIGGPLLSQALYDSATGEDSGQPPAPNAPTPLPYGDLRLIAIRFDPCFAHVGPITDPSTCQNQMRLVFQSFTILGGGGSAVDGAVHVFYSLTRDELIGIVSGIASLRAASGANDDLGPLAPHPIVAREGVSGAFAQGLFALVQAHAGPANLVRFTRFRSSEATWFFSGFNVAGSDFTPMPIPTLPNGTALPNGTTSESFFAGFGSNLEGQFTPSTGAIDNMQLLANLDLATAATPSALKAAFDAALRIENPGFHSPDTIDCASCHTSGLARATVGVKLGLDATGDPNLFTMSSPFVPAGDLKQTTRLDPGSNTPDIHVFSYKDTNATIAPRVINETAVVVDYLNSLGGH
jgi:hypothetical protein